MDGLRQLRPRKRAMEESTEPGAEPKAKKASTMAGDNGTGSVETLLSPDEDVKPVIQYCQGPHAAGVQCFCGSFSRPAGVEASKNITLELIKSSLCLDRDEIDALKKLSSSFFQEMQSVAAKHQSTEVHATTDGDFIVKDAKTLGEICLRRETIESLVKKNIFSISQGQMDKFDGQNFKLRSTTAKHSKVQKAEVDIEKGKLDVIKTTPRKFIACYIMPTVILALSISTPQHQAWVEKMSKQPYHRFFMYRLLFLALGFSGAGAANSLSRLTIDHGPGASRNAIPNQNSVQRFREGPDETLGEREGHIAGIADIMDRFRKVEARLDVLEAKQKDSRSARSFLMTKKGTKKNGKELKKNGKEMKKLGKEMKKQVKEMKNHGKQMKKYGEGMRKYSEEIRGYGKETKEEVIEQAKRTRRVVKRWQKKSVEELIREFRGIGPIGGLTECSGGAGGWGAGDLAPVMAIQSIEQVEENQYPGAKGQKSSQPSGPSNDEQE